MSRKKRAGDVITRKADSKLEHVVRLWATALGPHCGRGASALLERELLLVGVAELDRLLLSYEATSKLFATLFDLVLSFDVRGEAVDGSEIELAAGSRGFVGTGDGREIARILSNPLVLERVDGLGVTGAGAVFSQEDGLWRVRMKSLVGSSTWNLLPPVLQLIEPDLDDCIRGMELVRMMCAALGGQRLGPDSLC